MHARCYLCFLLFLAMPVWSQVEPSAYGPPAVSSETMQTPPLISGELYPSTTGSEARSNELHLGLSYQTAYNDNLVTGDSTVAISDTSYTMRPFVQIDQSTGRLHHNFAYDSEFTIYTNTSARNHADQYLREDIEYRISPYTIVVFRDSFQKSSNVLNQPNDQVTGSTQTSTAQVIAPFADSLDNTLIGEVTYQYGLNRMIGGSGTYMFQNYLNAARAAGLPDTATSCGSAFYNLRLPRSQYVGVLYQYLHMTASMNGVQSVTPVQTGSLFYTLSPLHGLGLSASIGPQHYSVTPTTVQPSASWTPAITAGMGWQTMRTNLEVKYLRSITGAGGLFGAFQSNSLRGTLRYRCARSWILSANTDYAIQKIAHPAFAVSYPGGHSVLGTAYIQHTMGEHLLAEFGYTRLHQSYAAVASVSKNPDSDRGYLSINYQFTRPLGR